MKTHKCIRYTYKRQIENVNPRIETKKNGQRILMYSLGVFSRGQIFFLSLTNCIFTHKSFRSSGRKKADIVRE